MPTFQIFKAGKKVDEVVGADVKTLGELLKKHNAASGAFTGKGRSLAGNSLALLKQLSAWRDIQTLTLTDVMLHSSAHSGRASFVIEGLKLA